MSLPARLALDTNCFIYLFEPGPSSRAEFLRREVFRAAAGGGHQLVASCLVVAELLVVPFRTGQSDSARRLRAAIEQLPGLQLVEVDTSLAVEAARLRGTSDITLADAVHAATAVAHADALLTNDRRLQAVEDHTPVLLLDDLVSG